MRATALLRRRSRPPCRVEGVESVEGVVERFLTILRAVLFAAARHSRLPLRTKATSAAVHYDIYELVRIIATHWPVGRVDDLSPDYREANILDPYLAPAMASLRRLRALGDGGDDAPEAPADA